MNTHDSITSVIKKENDEYVNEDDTNTDNDTEDDNDDNNYKSRYTIENIILNLKMIILH